MNITPDEVLRLAEAIGGRDGQIVALWAGVDGGRYSTVEIARIFGTTRYRVADIIDRVVRLIRLAAGDEHLDVEGYLIAGVMRRRAGLSPVTTDTIDTGISDLT